MKDKIQGAIIGAVVGDAIGLPFEFQNKKFIKKRDIKRMNKRGYHGLPVGTWSDDSSMIFCTMESMLNGYDYKDIGQMFCKWKYEAYWTPTGILFDIGSATANAIRRINLYEDYTGCKDEQNCGNGSLMRIIPLLFYIKNHREGRFKIISEVSSLTHGHIRCIIGCSIYLEICLNILDGDNKKTAYKKMQSVIKEEYSDYPEELKLYSRILDNDIAKFDKSTFSGSGYIVHTLESSLYSFMKKNNYKNAIYTAIMFGDDTDTVASITGGICGLYYGYDKIPSKWIDVICKKDSILELIDNFSNKYV